MRCCWAFFAYFATELCDRCNCFITGQPSTYTRRSLTLRATPGSYVKPLIFGHLMSEIISSKHSLLYKQTHFVLVQTTKSSHAVTNLFVKILCDTTILSEFSFCLIWRWIRSDGFHLKINCWMLNDWSLHDIIFAITLADCSSYRLVSIWFSVVSFQITLLFLAVEYNVPIETLDDANAAMKQVREQGIW